MATQRKIPAVLPRLLECDLLSIIAFLPHYVSLRIRNRAVSFCSADSAIFDRNVSTKAISDIENSSVFVMLAPPLTAQGVPVGHE
jgi:hypothetical protein